MFTTLHIRNHNQVFSNYIREKKNTKHRRDIRLFKYIFNQYYLYDIPVLMRIKNVT